MVLLCYCDNWTFTVVWQR